MDVTKAVYEAHLLRSTICLQMRYRLCLSFMHANVSENWSNNNKRRCHQRCCWQNTFCWVYRRSPNLWVSFMWPCICLWRAGADISRHKVGNLTSAKPLLYDYIISKKNVILLWKKIVIIMQPGCLLNTESLNLKLSEATTALLYVPPSLFDFIRCKFNDSCCISFTNLSIYECKLFMICICNWHYLIQFILSNRD